MSFSLHVASRARRWRKSYMRSASVRQVLSQRQQVARLTLCECAHNQFTTCPVIISGMIAHGHTDSFEDANHRQQCSPTSAGHGQCRMHVNVSPNLTAAKCRRGTADGVARTLTRTEVLIVWYQPGSWNLKQTGDYTIPFSRANLSTQAELARGWLLY